VVLDKVVEEEEEVAWVPEEVLEAVSPVRDRDNLRKMGECITYLHLIIHHHLQFIPCLIPITTELIAHQRRLWLLLRQQQLEDLRRALTFHLQSLPLPSRPLTIIHLVVCVPKKYYISFQFTCVHKRKYFKQRNQSFMPTNQAYIFGHRKENQNYIEHVYYINVNFSWLLPQCPHFSQVSRKTTFMLFTTRTIITFPPIIFMGWDRTTRIALHSL